MTMKLLKSKHDISLPKLFKSKQDFNLTKALSYVTLATIAVGVAMNLKDIGRYIRISTM
jgi:hypothetical protein